MLMVFKFMRGIALALTFLSLPLWCTAQDINYGFQVGLNLSSFRSDYFFHPNLGEGEIDAQLTFGMNSFIEYRPHKIGIAIEPGYIMKTLSATAINIQERFLEAKLHFINLPVILTIVPSDRFSFFVGPEVGYNFNTKIEKEEYSNPIINAFDFSISLGGLIRFSNKYGLGLKYSHGLTSLTTKELLVTTTSNPEGIGTLNTRTKSTYVQLFFRYFL